MKTNKKQAKKKRKVLVALLLLLFTAIVLSAGTYAWFSANQTVTVDDITVQVAASNGIQISTDAINFKTMVNNDDIINAYSTYPAAKNQLPTTTLGMVPVSTVPTKDANGLLTMYKGAIISNDDGENILETTLTSETTNDDTHPADEGDFIAFDIFLQVTEDTPVYLTKNSGISVPEGTDDKGLQNAGRMAFVYQGYVAPGSAASDAQSSKELGATYSYTYVDKTDPENPSSKTITPATVKIWELNNDVHKATALTNAQNVYGETYLKVSDELAPNFTTTGDNRYKYYGVVDEITKDDNIAVNSTDTTKFELVEPWLSTTVSGIDDTARPEVLRLKAGITKVRVYMWIEGQDVDCENNASGTSVQYNLQFSLLPSV